MEVAMDKRRMEIIGGMTREQAQRYFDRRMAKVKREALRLALDLSRANGTTFEHELAKLQRDMKDAVRERHGSDTNA